MVWCSLPLLYILTIPSPGCREYSGYISHFYQFFSGCKGSRVVHSSYKMLRCNYMYDSIGRESRELELNPFIPIQILVWCPILMILCPSKFIINILCCWSVIQIIPGFYNDKTCGWEKDSIYLWF
jgi:hypothetical protein